MLFLRRKGKLDKKEKPHPEWMRHDCTQISELFLNNILNTGGYVGSDVELCNVKILDFCFESFYNNESLNEKIFN